MMIFSLTETLLLLTVMQFEDESIYYNWQGANLCAGYLWSVNFNPIFVITGDSATSDSGCSQLHTTIIVTKLGFSQFQSPPPQSPHPSTIAARSNVCATVHDSVECRHTADGDRPETSHTRLTYYI